MKVNDIQLVQKIIDRDEKTLFELYSKYRKPLYNFIYSRIRDRALAEELVQDVFINFLESLRDFRYQSSLKTFIFTIARNKMIDYMRKKKIKNVVFSALPSFIVESITQIDLHDNLEKKELQHKLEQTFQELPNEYQVILRLKYLDNQSVQHISETLLKTGKATESLLYRARRAFMKVYSALP